MTVLITTTTTTTTSSSSIELDESVQVQIQVQDEVNNDDTIIKSNTGSKVAIVEEEVIDDDVEKDIIPSVTDTTTTATATDNSTPNKINDNKNNEKNDIVHVVENDNKVAIPNENNDNDSDNDKDVIGNSNDNDNDDDKNDTDDEDLEDILANMNIDKDCGVLDSLYVYDTRKQKDSQRNLMILSTTNESHNDNENDSSNTENDNDIVHNKVDNKDDGEEVNDEENDNDTKDSTKKTKKKLFSRLKLGAKFRKKKSESSIGTTSTCTTSSGSGSSSLLRLGSTCSGSGSSSRLLTAHLDDNSGNHDSNSSTIGTSTKKASKTIKNTTNKSPTTTAVLQFTDNDNEPNELNEAEQELELESNNVHKVNMEEIISTISQVFHRDEVFSKRYQSSVTEIQQIKDLELLYNILKLPLSKPTNTTPPTTTSTNTNTTPTKTSSTVTVEVPLRDQWDTIVHPKVSTSTIPTTSIILYNVQCSYVGTTIPTSADTDSNNSTSTGELYVLPNGILLSQNIEQTSTSIFSTLFRRGTTTSTTNTTPTFWKGIIFDRIHFITIVVPVEVPPTPQPQPQPQSTVSKQEQQEQQHDQEQAVKPVSSTDNETTNVFVPKPTIIDDTTTTIFNKALEEIQSEDHKNDGETANEISPTASKIDDVDATTSNVVDDEKQNITKEVEEEVVVEEQQDVQPPKKMYLLQMDIADGPDEIIYIGFDNEIDREITLQCFRKAVRYYHMYNNPTIISSSIGWQYQFVYTPAFTMAVTIHTDPLLDTLSIQQLNTVDEYNGYSPLHYAVKCNHCPAIRSLLEAGADPNLLSADKKQTPMYIATRDEFKSSIELLQSYGGQKSQLAAIEQGTTGTFFNSIGITNRIVQRKREKEVLTQQIIQQRNDEKRIQAEKVTSTMNKNMQLLQERGEQINEMSNKASALHDGASNYNTMATQLKQKMLKKKWYHLG